MMHKCLSTGRGSEPTGPKCCISGVEPLRLLVAGALGDDVGCAEPPELIDLIWNRPINPGRVFDLEPPPTCIASSSAGGEFGRPSSALRLWSVGEESPWAGEPLECVVTLILEDKP